MGRRSPQHKIPGSWKLLEELATETPSTRYYMLRGTFSQEHTAPHSPIKGPSIDEAGCTPKLVYTIRSGVHPKWSTPRDVVHATSSRGDYTLRSTPRATFVNPAYIFESPWVGESSIVLSILNIYLKVSDFS